ncbi:hypothetical protein LIER_36254 [Lithospermum erythrorhizon]|uniref:GTD-binding domain-containing protein n=1 Tax=Lithospermum erythrorhizon TaxID=34254 RepID=A0AAV3P4C6_LITER
MDLESSLPSTSLVKCCDCGCSCSPLMNRSLSGTCFRSVKRKFDKSEDEAKFVIPGLSVPQVARVEIENEVDVLRETVGNQQETIQDLCSELEEERNASSSAANEAMSMILRLQGEKAEIQMEARQFKRFVEEKMGHDQQEILALEDLLYKREQRIQSLTSEVQSYKHRLMSYGFTEAEIDQNNSAVEDYNLDDQFDFPAYDYPRLKCNMNKNHGYSDADNEVPYDVEKYAFGETPRSRDHLKDLEFRINELERSPKSIQPEGEVFSTKDDLEKAIVGQSPRHARKLSTSSAGTIIKEPEFTDSSNFGNIKKRDFQQWEKYSNLKKVGSTSESGDEIIDKVYTIDSMHPEVPYNSVAEPKASIEGFDDYMKTCTPMESLNQADFADPEIKKMYMRVQALEADRESMRQAIISMRTDKAQLVLLKEIAEHLCKEMPPSRSSIVAKPSLFGAVSFMSICKWIISFLFWKKKARRCRYMFGKSPNNTGLLMLLDNGVHGSKFLFRR